MSGEGEYNLDILEEIAVTDSFFELEKEGKIKNIEDNEMVIPYGDRSGEIIEPYLTDQWFLDTKKICIAVNDAIKNIALRFDYSYLVIAKPTMLNNEYTIIKETLFRDLKRI